MNHMVECSLTRSRRFCLAPGSLWVWLMLVGATLIGCTNPSEDPSLLARVGDRRITTSELRAFAAALPADGSPGAATRTTHKINLQTLIDRQILLLEARLRGLNEDEQALEQLKKREVVKLTEEMLRREVLERATVSGQEVQRAYEQEDWDERVFTLEIYVADAKSVDLVLSLLQQGEDFAEVGRLHSVDRYLKLPTGSPQSFTYGPYDGPRDVVAAVFALPVGGVTEPIRLFGGYVIAKVVERHKVGLKELADKIAPAVYKEKKKLLREAYLGRLRDDFNLTSNPEGMDQVMAVLNEKVSLDTLSAGQRRLRVYTYGDVGLNVEETVALLRTEKDRWRGTTRGKVIGELKEKFLPPKIMALDAHRIGVDTTAAFLQWRQQQREDGLIVRLRTLVLEEGVEISEEDLEAYYEEHRRLFRAPGRARVQELLVAEPAQARALVQELKKGLDMAALIRRHSTRENVEDGILLVYDSQAVLYGEAWMNAVMSAPLNELQGPVQTKGKEYSVFRVIERFPESFYTLERRRVREYVTRSIRERKERTVFNEYLEDLREEYAERIKIYEENMVKLQHEVQESAEVAPL